LGINHEQDGSFRAMADALRIAATQVAQQRYLAIGMDLDAVLRAAIHTVIAQQAIVFIQEQAKRLRIAADSLLRACQHAFGWLALEAGNDPAGKQAVILMDAQAGQCRRDLDEMGPGAPLFAYPAAGAFFRIKH
jgi:hypothetical protein